MSSIKQSSRTLKRIAKEKENAAKIAAKNRAALEKKKLQSDPAYLTAKAKQKRMDDISRIMTIYNTYEKTRKRIPKLDLKFIVNSSEKYKYPLMQQILIAFNDIVNRVNISQVSAYAEKRILLFLKNCKDPQIVLPTPQDPLYKVGIVNLLVRIKKNIVDFSDDVIQKNTSETRDPVSNLPINPLVNNMVCFRELCKTYIWNLKINECDNFTLLSKEDQTDKFTRALFRICKIVNNPIPNLLAAEEAIQNDAKTQINKEALAAQSDAANGIVQPSYTGGGDNFENKKPGLNLDPDFLRVSAIFRNFNSKKDVAITDHNIKVIIEYAENKKVPLNINALKVLNEDANKYKIGLWIGYITPKLVDFLNSQKLLPKMDNPLYHVNILNNAIKIKKGIQSYKKSDVVRGSKNTILDYPSLQQLCIGYINDIKINTCAIFNLKGKDQKKELYTNELYRQCSIVGVPIKAIDLSDRNLNIMDVLKKKVNKAKITPVFTTEGFINIKNDNNNIEYLKNYLLILIFILIFFYLCRL